MGWESPGLPSLTAGGRGVTLTPSQNPLLGCPVCGSLESWQDLLGRELWVPAP